MRSLLRTFSFGLFAIAATLTGFESVAGNATLNGFVCDTTNSLPLTGATVTLDLKNPDPDGEFEFEATAGEFGFFYIGDIPHCHSSLV